MRLNTVHLLCLLVWKTNCEFHYSIRTELPIEHVQALVEKENGIVHHYVETLRVYHAVLPVKLKLEQVSMLIWLRNLALSWMNYHSCMRLHEHPKVELVYQPTLRVSKREIDLYSQPPELELTPYSIMDRSTRPDRMILSDDAQYDAAYQALAKILQKAIDFDDPASKFAWQYLNDGHRGSGIVGFDINIYPLYVANCTGKGIRTLILDDAIDRLHWDLKDNYDGNISVNLNEPQFRRDPRGSHSKMRSSDSHGTQCAGLVAAAANNGLCSHGVAYQSRIGAVRMLAGPVTDILEANGLSYRQNVVDIYCASWGPSDDGQTMDLPRNLTEAAIAAGSEHGRKGLGSFFIFASGNGGKLDHCGADGFVSSPEIIAVAALTDEADRPYYGEACSANRIAVPVAGSSYRLNGAGDVLPSTTANNKCTMHFVGTSAAAPLAAGCFALALEARPNITKRDLENILPWSGRVATPVDTELQVNGAGVIHTPNAGFGLLDCTRMIQLTQQWKPVGPLCKRKLWIGTRKTAPWAEFQDSVYGDDHFQHINAETIVNFQMQLEELNASPGSQPMNSSKPVEIIFKFEPRSNLPCELEVVEKVVVSFQWKHMCRGMVDIQLVSPSGANATILGHRVIDQYAGGVNMTINSVLFWGETSYGEWIVKIQSSGRCPNSFVSKYNGQLGTLVFLQLDFWGSSKADSGFERNKDLILPHLPKVSQNALQTVRAHRLYANEVQETFNFQRWKALNNTELFVKMKRPDLF